MIGVAGLQALTERLRRIEMDHALSPALERAAGTLREAVRQRLSHVPGERHDAPWIRSGELRDSIGVTMVANGAVVGSGNRAAVPQELGTRLDPPRPFLAPSAAGKSVTIASDIADTAIALIRETVA